MATFGERLKRARQEAGLSQGKLASAVGLTQQAIAAMEGAREGSKHVAALAEALNVSPTWLAHERGPMRSQGQLPGVPAPVPANVIPRPDATELPPITTMAKDVPVFGVGMAGGEAEFEMNRGDIIDYVRRPLGIIGNKGIFAIYLVGDSMEPWRLPGDPIYLDPHRKPRVGHHVLVELHPKSEGDPSPALVKKLLAETPTQLRLAQYNPPDDRIVVPLRRVKKVFRILEWGELLGI